MKLAAATLVVLAVLAGAAAVWLWEPWNDDSGGPADFDEFAEEFRNSGCRRLAGVAASLAENDPAPVEFLRALGREAAGIRPPPRAYSDLARGGRDLIPGKGFLARFDDGSVGQARHFAGIAVARTYGSAENVRRASIEVRRDPADSPDGRLTDEALEFANGLIEGEIEVAESPEWLLDRLCRGR